MKMQEKLSEYRDMSIDELKVELANMKADFCKARLGMDSNNNTQLGTIKKDIARIQTIIRERELGINTKVNKA